VMVLDDPGSNGYVLTFGLKNRGPTASRKSTLISRCNFVDLCAFSQLLNMKFQTTSVRKATIVKGNRPCQTASPLGHLGQVSTMALIGIHAAFERCSVVK
jgi:hypothetical protein